MSRMSQAPQHWSPQILLQPHSRLSLRDQGLNFLISAPGAGLLHEVRWSQEQEVASGEQLQITFGNTLHSEFAGCITTEGGQLSRADAPAYGGLQGPSSFYQGHQSPVAQQEALSHPSHKFQPPALCSSSVCCSHCSPVSPSLKGQVPPPSIHPGHSFRQPSEMVPQQLGSLQGSTLLPREKELPCTPHPPKLLQPWLETQPAVEPESTPQRLGHQLASQPVCIVPPQDVQQGAHAQPTLQTPSIQVQFGHHQKLKLSHFQQQPQQQLPPLPPLPPPPQPQPPPPLPPSQHLASGQHESTPGPACSQNVDIMHHKFELEEMQKDLELLLQAQQPSLQLSQTKSPQHLQQTIVGQINYIVRQPAPVQSQSQEDTVQVGLRVARADVLCTPGFLREHSLPSLRLARDQVFICGLSTALTFQVCPALYLPFQGSSSPRAELGSVLFREA